MTTGILRALNQNFEIFAKNANFFNFLKMYSKYAKLVCCPISNIVLWYKKFVVKFHSITTTQSLHSTLSNFDNNKQIPTLLVGQRT